MLSETGIEEEDIRDGDADIYHVFLQVGNRFYDGSGKIDRSYLSKFAEAEYGSDASLWQGFPIDEATRRVISYQTAWDIEWVDFYRFFENIIS
jgi:hypothetical protein